MALRFSTDSDYNESEGRPHLDENGIRDAESSRRTRTLVVTRAENLRLWSVSPQTDDGLSTEDFEEDPGCVEAITLQYGSGIPCIASTSKSKTSSPSSSDKCTSTKDLNSDFTSPRGLEEESKLMQQVDIVLPPDLHSVVDCV